MVPARRIRFFGWLAFLALLVSAGCSKYGDTINPVVVDQGATPEDTTLDHTIANTPYEAGSIIYAGPQATQTGVTTATFIPERTSIVRGRIVLQSAALASTRALSALQQPTGSPVEGATITVLGHPELGRSVSLADGTWSMVVNGGGPLTFVVGKSGYPTAHRAVDVPWQEWVNAPDIVLTPYDTASTLIDFSQPVQVHRGSTVTDTEGTRRATILFFQGTTAQMEFADGSTSPLASFHVRATEYTVGGNGPAAMPAELPPSVLYTSCAEFSADEAVDAGASGVRFSGPVVSYQENYLGFPVGTRLPVAQYNRLTGGWEARNNGRVVKVISVSSGLADLDVDGSGASSTVSMTAVGITDDERLTVATLYPVNQELWRVSLDHFSPWDSNAGGAPPSTARPPDAKNPPQRPDEACKIDCVNQVVGEDIPITSTPFFLRYQSDRVPGRKVDYTVTLPVSGATVPASLKRIDVQTTVCGRTFVGSYAAQPNQTHTFTWDGKDAFGRFVNGAQTARIQIGYVYDAVYTAPADWDRAWASVGDVPLTADRARQEITLLQIVKVPVGTWTATGSKLGGWTLSCHHHYDPSARVLHQGDGTRRSVDSTGPVVRTVAGNGSSGTTGDGGPATQAPLSTDVNGISDVAVSPDGTLYIADNEHSIVRSVDRSGIITTFAGGGTPPDGIGDGLPARQAAFAGSASVIVGPDGSVFIGDMGHARIRRVGPDGIVQTVAGGGTPPDGLGDGLPATQAKLSTTCLLEAIGPDGSLFITDNGNNRIRRVGPEGIIRTVAGDGTVGFLPVANGTLATKAALGSAMQARLGPYGELYISERDQARVYRMDTSGRMYTVAGGGADGTTEGIPAVQASLTTPLDAAMDAKGNLYIAEALRHRIRVVTPDGMIRTVMGTGLAGFTGDGEPGTATALNTPADLCIGPYDEVFVCDRVNGRVRKLAAPLPGFDLSTISIPSRDGDQLFVFDGRGRHVRTVNALTGATLLAFGYDASDLLSAVLDGDGLTTTLARDSRGNLTSIVAPAGQTTVVTSFATGYLATLANPAGDTWAFTSSDGGLLLTARDPRQSTQSCTYDALGRLTRYVDPAGGSETLARAEIADGFEVTDTTALGRQTKYMIRYLASGDRLFRKTHPTGAVRDELRKPDQTTTVTEPDGMVVTYKLGPDPRWGMQAPIAASSSVRTPVGALQRNVTGTRTVMLADPDDPLSLQIQTDTTVVNGKAYTTAFTAADRRFVTTTPLGRTRTTIVDPLGRPVSSQADPAVAPVTSTYAGGLLTRIEQGPLNLTWTYDAARRPISIADALGHTSTLAYDNADRVTSATLASGRIYRYWYDAAGNLIKVRPPAVPEADTDLTYNPLGMLASHALPGGSSFQYAYDLDGNATSTTLPGGRVRATTYDAGGRFTGESYVEAQVAAAYGDATARVASLTRTPAGGGTAQQLGFTYDGALLSQIASTGPATGQVGYTYDNDLLGASLDVLGTNLAVTRDNDGLPTAYGPFAITRGGPAGAISQISDGTLSVVYTYDALGRLARRTHTAGTVFYDLQLAYDGAGRVSQKIENVGGTTHTYDYVFDADGRLTGVSRDSAAFESYAYDPNGNRTSSQVNGGPVQTATYDGQDRLLTLAGVVYQSNSDGFVVQRGSDTFSYAAAWELTGATVAANSVTYAYDAVGRVTSRDLAGDVVQFVYEGPGPGARLAATRDASGDTIHFHDQQGSLIALRRSGTFYYVGSDQVGTPRIVVNTAGVVQKTREHDTWGNVLADSAPGFALAEGFAGGIQDPVTKLVRFGVRDYEPASGRWMSKDPALLNGGQANLHAYAANQPQGMVDRTGLDVVVFWVGYHTVYGVGDPDTEGGMSFYDYTRANGTDQDVIDGKVVAGKWNVYNPKVSEGLRRGGMGIVDPMMVWRFPTDCQADARMKQALDEASKEKNPHYRIFYPPGTFDRAPKDFGEVARRGLDLSHRPRFCWTEPAIVMSKAYLGGR